MTHPPQLILGVDTHKDVHVAVPLDRLSRWLAAASFDTSDASNRDLVAWTTTMARSPPPGSRASAATATGWLST